MDPTRKRERSRILQLFRPYRWRLAAVMGLIVFSAGLAMLQPFLLRDVLDEGIFGHKTTWGIVPGRGHIPPAPGSSAPSSSPKGTSPSASWPRR